VERVVHETRTLKRSSRAVQDALDSADIESIVEQLPDSTRTAKEAAKGIGCGVAQIAKSILFVGKRSNRTVMVIASGVNRIDESKVKSHFGEEIEKATPEQVRTATGYAIGGVPPCGHISELEIYIDEDLLELEALWAAAGTPNAVFRILPAQLEKLTKGKVINVTKNKNSA